MAKVATIHPKRVRLFGKVGESVSAAVTITPEPQYPFRVVEAQPVKANNLRCRVEGSGDTGGPFLLQIENIRTTPGRYAEVIVVKTDSDALPELRVPVYGNIIAPPPPEATPDTNPNPPGEPDAAKSQS